jgi:hypothetical protein
VIVRHKIERTGTYKAVDQDRGEHTIYVYSTFEDIGPPDSKPVWQRSANPDRHKMRNGNLVKVNDDGTLEEDATGRKMRRA